MDDSHTQSSINGWHLNWILSEYEDGHGIQPVIWFASRYGSLWLICQLPDRKLEMMILQEVVYLPEWFNHITKFQIMQEDVKVELLNHYSLNLHNCHFTTGQCSICSGSNCGSGINRIHQYWQWQLPAGSQNCLACILAQCRKADVVALPLGKDQSQDFWHLTDNLQGVKNSW